MSSNFFDEEDIEATESSSSSFFDQDDIDDSIPMGGELSNVVSEEMEAAPDPEAEKMSQSQAALQGVSQGATFGFGDEIAGGVEAAGRVVGLQGLGGPITDIGIADDPVRSKEALLKAYREGREAERSRNVEAQEEHPGTYLGGELAGGFSIPIPGAGFLKGAAKAPAATKALTKAPKVAEALPKVASETLPSLATKVGTKVGETAKSVGQIPSKLKNVDVTGKVAEGMATGATVGGLEAAGRTEEDLLTAEGLEDVAGGIGLGAGLGGAIGKLGQKMNANKMAKLEAKAAQLEKQGNIDVVKAAGANKKIMSEILKSKSKYATSDDAKDVGKTLVEEGIFKVKQTASELKDAVVNKMRDVAENRIAPLSKQADELVNQQPLESFKPALQKFAKGIEDGMEDIASRKEYATANDEVLYEKMVDISRKVISEAQGAFESPDKISKLIELKRKLGKNINWQNLEASAHNEHLLKLQSSLDNMIEEIVTASSPKIAQEMREANKVFHHLDIANRLSTDKAIKEALEQKGITFKDYFLGGAVSAITGNKYVGAAAVAAKKVTENITGKSVGSGIESAVAKRQLTKADKIRQQVAENAPKIKDPLKQTMRSVTAGAAAIDKQESEEPYKLHQKTAKIIERATPEMLVEQAQTIREQHGEQGENLAKTLEKMAEKDKSGRRTLMFHLLQNPQNRKMLIPNNEEENK